MPVPLPLCGGYRSCRLECVVCGAPGRSGDPVVEAFSALPLLKNADAELLEGGLVDLGDLYLEDHLLRLVDPDMVCDVGGVGLGDLDHLVDGLLVRGFSGQDHRVLGILDVDGVLRGHVLDLGVELAYVTHHVDVEEGRAFPLFPDDEGGRTCCQPVQLKLGGRDEEQVRDGRVGDGDPFGGLLQVYQDALVEDHLRRYPGPCRSRTGEEK